MVVPIVFDNHIVLDLFDLAGCLQPPRWRFSGTRRHDTPSNSQSERSSDHSDRRRENEAVESLRRFIILRNDSSSSWQCNTRVFSTKIQLDTQSADSINCGSKSRASHAIEVISCGTEETDGFIFRRVLQWRKTDQSARVSQAKIAAI